MRYVMSLAACACLAVGAMAMVGCDNNDRQQPSHASTFAGGNGEFGETPGQAGRYSNGSGGVYNNNSAPTTQPSGQ